MKGGSNPRFDVFKSDVFVFVAAALLLFLVGSFFLVWMLFQRCLRNVEFFVSMLFFEFLMF